MTDVRSPLTLPETSGVSDGDRSRERSVQQGPRPAQRRSRSKPLGRASPQDEPIPTQPAPRHVELVSLRASPWPSAHVLGRPRHAPSSRRGQRARPSECSQPVGGWRTHRQGLDGGCGGTLFKPTSRARSTPTWALRSSDLAGRPGRWPPHRSGLLAEAGASPVA